MRKAIIIGCPGSGKSTFGRDLRNISGLPLFHLDNMYWKEDKTTVENEVFLEELKELLKKECWIIDGNYYSTMDMRLKECDSVFFLDYPLEICLRGIEERKGKSRSDIPWIETETDEEFIAFVKSFNPEVESKIIELLTKYKDKNIYVFHSREEADEFLSKL